MSTTVLADTEVEELTYERTVPRGMVHRWSLSEVFLTGYRRSGEQDFACAAQLPSSHAYFRDHPCLPGRHDPLNVLEACRQAVTYAAHVHQGVPMQTTFMVSGWTLDIADGTALAAAQHPGELAIDGHVTDRRERGGRIRRLVFAMDLTLDGRPLGALTMDVSCTPTEQYHMLRRVQRGSDAPTAFTLPADPVGPPMPPAAVGRRDPGNVVLDDARRTADTLSATLSPRTFANRSMYDHPYDHVPAMVFSEAARQCALLLTDSSAEPRRLAGRFVKFAELDAPVAITAERGPDGTRMTARQAGATVAEVDVVVG